MMLGGHPLFFDDGDDFGFYQSPYGGRRPRSNNYYYQRRAAEEEARRRAELERYYRMKELEEQEKLRQRQEYQRQLRRQQKQQEEAYRRRMLAQQQQEEEYRRRLAEAERLRRMQEEERMRSWLGLSSPHRHDPYEMEESSVSSSEEEEPEGMDYVIVRGRDGRLYRVQRSLLEKQQRTAAAQKARQTRMETESSDEDEDEGEMMPSLEKPVATQKQAEPKSTTTVPISFHPSTVTEEQPHSTTIKVKTPSIHRRKSSLKPKKQKKKITVIVEDASDSENEDESKSVWRNRRPSPGQWIEPVDDSYLYH